MSPLSYLATENMMPGLNPRAVSVFQGGGKKKGNGFKRNENGIYTV